MKTTGLAELALLPAPDTDFARGVVLQLSGWLHCAHAYRTASGFDVGEDVELAPGWVSIGWGLRAMLESSSAAYPSRFGNLPRFELAQLVADVLQEQGYCAD
ncbi:MAG TPA: hypothetical protein VF627_11850 [Abditibacterium sp.]|jgi:hypothetical protein